MNPQAYAELQELTRKFNINSRYLAREISLTEYTKMKKEYNAENRNHLAKILAIRGIELS